MPVNTANAKEVFSLRLMYRGAISIEIPRIYLLTIYKVGPMLPY